MGKRGGRRRNRATQWEAEQEEENQNNNLSTNAGGGGDHGAPSKRQKTMRGKKEAASPVLVDQVEMKLMGVENDHGDENDNSSIHRSLPAPFSLEEEKDEKDSKREVSTFRNRIRNVWMYLGHNHKACNWKPSKIQQHIWSLLVETQWNTIGVAPTGSGKTFAYAIPTIVLATSRSASSSSDDDDSSSAILVLVPTRELAQQVAKVFARICKAIAHLSENDHDDENKTNLPIPRSKSKLSAMTIPVITAFGGTPRFRQQEELDAAAKAGRSVVVATPGRLLDLIKENQKDDNTATNNGRRRKIPVFQWIILDEADQLGRDGDLGPQVDEILQATKQPTSRLVLVSATYPEKARSKFETWVGKQYVLAQVDHVQQESLATAAPPAAAPNTTADGKEKNGEAGVDDSEIKSASASPPFINKNSGSFARIPSHLEQLLHVCSEHKKPRKLLHTLQQIYKKHPNERSRPLGIVFFSKIEKLKHISKLLEKEGVTGGVELHSQLVSNTLRESHLAQFACGQKPLLLATDLAARGIDVPSVQFIIQYDFPGNLQQYVHRCGRAGRSHDEFSTSSTMKQQPKPTIYSFFTRNLKPMAPDLVRLLEANQAWVDPNLRDLAQQMMEADPMLADPGSKKLAVKKSSKKDKGKETDARPRISHEGYGDHEDIDDFPELSANRIVLKRAGHVSDASSSSSSDSDSDDDDDDDDAAEES